MIPGTRYYVEIIARRQTVLAPVLVFLAVLGIVYATDAGPPLAAAAVPAAVFVPLGAWLMRVCATAESRAFADVTVVALGSPGRRLVARAAAAVVFAAAMTGAACVWARLANPHPYPAGVIVEIAAMTLGAATAGIGVGALFAPPLRATAGTATIAVTSVVIVSLVVRWMPPLGPLLHAFIGVRPPRVWHAAIAIGQAAAVGAAGFAASYALGRRAG